jgi:DNA-binding NarL/FixJ family response regulator
MTLRVLLVDDHEMVRTALRLVLATTTDIEVVGEAADGDEAVRLSRKLRPDVVLMDIRMPGTNGIEATAAITAAGDRTGGDAGCDDRAGLGDGTTRVLVLTTFDDDEYVFGALVAGASGFLVKDMDLDDIVFSPRRLPAGLSSTWCARPTGRRLAGSCRRLPTGSGTCWSWSPRALRIPR